MRIIIVILYAVMLLGCDNSSDIHKCQNDHILILNRPSANDFSQYKCYHYLRDTTFYNDISKVIIKNCNFDTLFLSLYEINCGELLSILPSKIDNYRLKGDSMMLQSSDLAFLGKPDKIVSLNMGESGEFFVFVKNTSTDTIGFKYWYAAEKDSMGLKKTFYYTSTTYPYQIWR